MPTDLELPEPDSKALEAANEVVKQAIAEAESTARMSGQLNDPSAQALLDATDNDGVRPDGTQPPRRAERVPTVRRCTFRGPVRCISCSLVDRVMGPAADYPNAG